jgi:hypothetical protein
MMGVGHLDTVVSTACFPIFELFRFERHEGLFGISLFLDLLYWFQLRFLLVPLNTSVGKLIQPDPTPRVHPGVLRSLSFRFTEHLLGAPAPTCLVGSMENGSQNAREIRSQNAAKPFVTGSETNDRTAMHGQAAPGQEKKPLTTKTQLRLDLSTD